VLTHCKQLCAFVMHVWSQAGIPVEQGSVMFKAAATATAASAAFPPFCKMRMPACMQCHVSNTIGSDFLLAKERMHGRHVSCLSAALIRLQTGHVVAADSKQAENYIQGGCPWWVSKVCVQTKHCLQACHFGRRTHVLCTHFVKTRRHQQQVAHFCKQLLLTSDAKGCEDATMPRVPMTGDRLEVKSISCTLAWASAGVFAVSP